MDHIDEEIEEELERHQKALKGNVRLKSTITEIEIINRLNKKLDMTRTQR